MSWGAATTPSSSISPISSAKASWVRRSTSSAVDGVLPKDIRAAVAAGISCVPSAAADHRDLTLLSTSF